MRKLMPTMLVVVALIIVAACSNSATNLTGKDWHLSAITEKTPAFQGVVPPADQSKYTITFKTDGTFIATADCNSASGTYTTSGSSGLTIVVGPSTRVYCPDGSFADLFVHALGNAASYAIANDALTITLKDGGTLTFVAATAPAASESAAASSAAVTASPTPTATARPTAGPTATPAPTPKPTATQGTGASAQPTPTPTAQPTPTPTAQPSPGADLIGKTWRLTTITEKNPAFQGVVPTADQDKYTITFSAGGTFAATADCNQVAGTWTATSSGGLTITLGPSTAVGCEDGSLADLYVLGLSNAASYAVVGDQLTITLHDQGTLVYKQKV